MSEGSALTPRGVRITMAVVGPLGMISFCCAVMYHAALLDIWHLSGSPDFSNGGGVAAVEWRGLAMLVWPMLLFHLAFLGVGSRLVLVVRRTMGASLHPATSPPPVQS